MHAYVPRVCQQAALPLECGGTEPLVFDARRMDVKYPF